MKYNRWMLMAGATVVTSLLTLTVVDVNFYFAAPKRGLAEGPGFICNMIQGQAHPTGFSGGPTEGVVRQFASLDLVRSLVFTNVRVVDGDVRFINGGYREDLPGDPRQAFGFDPYYGFGSYGSYGAEGPMDPDDRGVGLARLKGGGHIEIKAEAGQLIKFRGAPLSSTPLFFQGRWERPGDDPAFTERARIFLQIANTLLAQCH